MSDERATHVLVLISVPPTLKGAPIEHVRRVLWQNRNELLDHIAQGVVQYFDKPHDYNEILAVLQNEQRKAEEST